MVALDSEEYYKRVNSIKQLLTEVEVASGGYKYPTLAIFSRIAWR